MTSCIDPEDVYALEGVSANEIIEAVHMEYFEDKNNWLRDWCAAQGITETDVTTWIYHFVK